MQDSSDEAQRRLRTKTDEIQSFADRKDMKKFFDALKTVYGPQSSGTTPILSADGTSLLTDKEAILKRWAEHFDGEKEAIPQKFKDATFVHLFKRKGNPQICDNHRGISLLSIAGKILARVLLNRLNEHLERSGLLPESQCGFRKNRETTDMIFTARQL